MRIIKIIHHETFTSPIIDPLGGSYYVEWLTSEMEKRVWEILDQVDKMGGFIKSMENGYFWSLAESNLYREDDEAKSGKRVRVGVNKYVEPDEEIKISDFKIAPDYEERRIKELTEFKQSRDNNMVQQALNELSLKLRNGNGDGLVSALIEAARADATLGEMCEVMRREHGWIKIT